MTLYFIPPMLVFTNMTSFYLPKKATALEQAISTEIRAMYTDGAMTALIQKYGADPAQFLKPTEAMAKARRGVDRPADWTPPTI